MAHTKARKYVDVEIEFMNMDDAMTENATVIKRGDEMVLDIPNDDGSTAYLIVGKNRGNSYGGINSASGNVAKVRATWTELGEGFVGRWIEDGSEWLFSFRLSGE